MFKLVLLASSVVVVLGGSSPNAEFVDDLADASDATIPSSVIEDGKLDVPGLVEKYGYPIETHRVTTKDGYILKMHRIPHGRDRNFFSSANKPIVFLMHGLLGSSADHLIVGPEKSLGYILAEEGYDVWMGNARGSYYSRAHRRLNPDSLDQTFWRFSWDEIGNLDLPACLDYIERVTGQSTLHFIGHSQGSTAFVVLNSLRPEYNKKFISFQGLAPAAFFNNNKNFALRLVSPLGDILESVAFLIGRGEVLGNRDVIIPLAAALCTGTPILGAICTSLLVTGTTDHYNQTLVPALLGHAPAGASFRQLVHYGQIINTNKFRRFDYNRLTNLEIYGSNTPPEYDLSLVTAPAYIHYSEGDLLVDPKDAELLASKLGNLAGLYKVDSPDFSHFDFIWNSEPAKDRLNKKVLSSMKNAERKFKVKGFKKQEFKYAESQYAENRRHMAKSHPIDFWPKWR